MVYRPERNRLDFCRLCLEWTLNGRIDEQDKEFVDPALAQKMIAEVGFNEAAVRLFGCVEEDRWEHFLMCQERQEEEEEQQRNVPRFTSMWMDEPQERSPRRQNGLWDVLEGAAAIALGFYATRKLLRDRN